MKRLGSFTAIVIAGAGLAGAPGARAETPQILASPTVTAPQCRSSHPALATSGELIRTARKLRSGQPLTILAIGSSSTQGIGASSLAATYPAQLAAELRKRLPKADIRIVPAGIGGEKAAQTIMRLEQDIDLIKPDLVIWQVGTNDALSNVNEDDFRAIVERGVTAAASAHADLILLDQQFFPSVRRKDRYERFVSIVRDVGARKHTCVFRRYSLMKSWAEGSDSQLRAMLSRDGFHMSDTGYACMARILAVEIIRVTERPALAASAALIP